MNGDIEPINEHKLDCIARGIAVGVVPVLWLLNWLREATSAVPYSGGDGGGMQYFLIVTAVVFAMLGTPFVPALVAVVRRPMTATSWLTAAMVFTMGCAGSIVLLVVFSDRFSSQSRWFGLLLVGAALTWAAVRAVAGRAGVG